MKIQLCLAAVFAALLMIASPARAQMGDPCAPGTDDPQYCEPAAPTVTTNPATDITANSATLNGSVGPNKLATEYRFEYGTATGQYGTVTEYVDLPGDPPGTDAQDVSMGIIALTPGTTYFFRITARNTAGETQGNEQQFTTAAAPTPYGAPPTVVTGPATSVTQASAVLTGTINPNGSQSAYAFQFGLTTTYGTVTPATQAGSGSVPVPAAATVAGLQPSTNYNFRIVGANAAGFLFGANATFRTLAAGGDDDDPPRKVKPRLGLNVKPKRDRTRPYRFRARGKIKRRRGVSKRQACRGRVRITIFKRNKRVVRRTARIKRRNCKYSKRLTAKRRTKGTRGRLRVRARFLGNSRLRKVSSRRVSVRYGPRRRG